MAIEGQRMMSKTQHYRKITKPLLERKRRARMNHYLDELKELIVETMEAQGEHVTKLEKADILEMTVQYLKTMKQIETLPDGPNINAEKFRAGYTQAAYEVSKVFASFPGMDVKFGAKLMKHLGYQLDDINVKPQFLSEAASSPGRKLYDLSCDQRENAVELIKTASPHEHHPKAEINEIGDVWRPW